MQFEVYPSQALTWFFGIVGGLDTLWLLLFFTASFILSGATAIGIGTELIPNEAIARRQSKRIHELARRFTKLVNDAREQIEAWKRSQVVKEFTGTEKCEK